MEGDSGFIDLPVVFINAGRDWGFDGICKEEVTDKTGWRMLVIVLGSHNGVVSRLVRVFETKLLPAAGLFLERDLYRKPRLRTSQSRSLDSL